MEMMKDEDSLICDFAEYYHIYDWRALPFDLAATLASGLSDDSRSKRRISGNPAKIDTILMANIADLLSMWIWAHTKDGKEPPARYVDILFGKKKDGGDVMSFSSPEEFDEAWRSIVEGGD